jgi:hypothetical protein
MIRSTPWKASRAFPPNTRANLENVLRIEPVRHQKREAVAAIF